MLNTVDCLLSVSFSVPSEKERGSRNKKEIGKTSSITNVLGEKDNIQCYVHHHDMNAVNDTNTVLKRHKRCTLGLNVH